MSDPRTTNRRRACGQEGGYVLLVAILATLVPLIVVVGASSLTTNGRTRRLQNEVDEQKALVAAESGIDTALYLASTAAGLTSGASFSREFDDGSRFDATATYLRTNGEDDDDDKVIDDADENVYRIRVVGTYRHTTRRLVAYLGQKSASASMPSALSLVRRFSGSELHVQGSSQIDGRDYLTDGSLSGDPAMPGATIEAPGTVSQLTANIPSSDRSKVIGDGGSPSVAVSTSTTDFSAIQTAIQNAANVVLTSGSYTSYNFGSAATNTYNVIYRSGSITFKKSTGAGVMFINGNLHVEESFRFDGIIYVAGDVEIHDDVKIYGAIVTGPSCPHFYLEGSAKVRYSSQAIAEAGALIPGKYVAFNGWQEVSRH
ncbi:MAG: hypothetical protein R3F56_16550 [Planctomycetota bacterium]